MKCPICDQEEVHFLSCLIPEYLQHIEAKHDEELKELQAKYEASMKKIAELTRNTP